MDEATVKATDNGPYLVRGPVTILDGAGNAYTVERKTVALCRCGGSATKPFCDGTHSRNGFRSAVRTDEG